MQTGDDIICLLVFSVIFAIHPNLGSYYTLWTEYSSSSIMPRLGINYWNVIREDSGYMLIGKTLI